LGCIFTEEHKRNLSASSKGRPAWNRGRKCPEESEKMKIKLSSEVIDVICNLYKIITPESIALVLSGFGIYKLSSYPIQRVLKEAGVYIDNDRRFNIGRGGKVTFPLTISDIPYNLSSIDCIYILNMIVNIKLENQNTSKEQYLDIIKSYLSSKS